MTRAQSFRMLTSQSLFDRLALVTFTPKQSLNHTPSLQGPDPDIETIIRQSDTVRLQNA